MEEGSCFLLAASAICISTIWKAQVERCAERRPSVTKQRARDLQIVQQWPESRNRSLKSKPLARRVSTAEFRRRARVAAPRSLRGTPSVELVIVRTFSNPFGPTAIRQNVLPNRSSDLGSAENVVRKKGTSRRWPWGPGQSGPARCHRTRSCGYRWPTRPPASARRADGHATVTSGADRGRHAATNDGGLKMWSWPWSS